ncbi:hypothetical protein GCM10007973_15210 [Polymorphobacter multimanifer]|uniref:Vgr related protein n=1 Tax=Polymorphobacter multimanifer TaxID=1070431 RepID=A0A841L0L8_9SPHN|nr:vgr related protein [Polymorphobacter multimanifer]MBB6226217.1 hypothetical protein [Polymorphobacter multimanifer]GGI79572.1 hypothetical protein GCM10007973_15210 [Polymorphobacter multimanifer]
MPATDTQLIRNLTGSERVLLASVFGTTLDADPVTIRRQKWWMLQPWWITMAPDGHVWCHPNGPNWSPCYASDRLGMQAHFIHELTHVWQHQHGINLLLKRAPWAPYRYRLQAGKRFADYGIEQQACIVADAFLLRAGRPVAGGSLAAYAEILPFGDWG